MIEWNEMQLQIRDMVRRFVEQEVKPNLEALEHGELPPYEILRKMVKSFGIADMAKARFAREKDRAPRSEDDKRPKTPSPEANEARGMEVAMQMIPIIELCRYSPGMVTALGVIDGADPGGDHGARHRAAEGALGAAAAHARQDRRVGHHRAGLGLGRVRRHEVDGERAATATATCSTARRPSSPTGPTPTPSSSSASSTTATTPSQGPQGRSSFILDKGTPGLTQSKPLRKMGLHSSPTGELFLDDVRVEQRAARSARPRTLAARTGAKDTFTTERTGVAAMALRHRRTLPAAVASSTPRRACSSGAPSASFSSSSSSSPRWKWRA